MKRLLTLILTTLLSINISAQIMKTHEISVEIDTSKEKVWEAITTFQNYPKWNSVLKMTNNDDLILGNKFQVTITQPNGKQSKFKAKAVSKENLQSFTGCQP